ncbi:putative ABC1 transport protein [Venustampulla echinocandica]|uniref:Putative ABC1 transport protein n=1 Tax=Venustampulla echinocandica TaxID=2656787 RepID=A0A370TGB4_9HELO|nr:putative ABC1 transport protein [Venustampulla echinocandica]RDL33925.1 putative ABC1 transport protein [Venustampulla echinocandica]
MAPSTMPPPHDDEYPNGREETPAEDVDNPGGTGQSTWSSSDVLLEGGEDGSRASISTGASSRERQFEHVAPEDRAELHRIASSIGGSVAFARSQSIPSATIEQRNMLVGMETGDPVLDPTSPRFDVYKWTKMIVRLIDEKHTVLRRAGIVWKNLKVCGSGSKINYQNTVGSVLLAPLRIGRVFGRSPEKSILNEFDGVLKSGEMLVVLGRPGSGCSTLLKSLMGELHGLDMKPQSEINYNGITQKQMRKHFKGEMVYNQEVDKHFPHLTVRQTLEFASRVRTPRERLVEGLSRETWAEHMAKVMMAVFGLSHTANTRVGNEFIRGVSGGERKRVSIAEMALARSPIAAWDNSTRGLDAATALEFTRSLRMTSNLLGQVHLVAIYQASQAIYDEFDRAVVLYEGRQIFFGPCGRAKQYFVDMGWECPPRQTTGDFLTSVTNPSERTARDGFAERVPRTAEEFERYWKESAEYRALKVETEEHEKAFPIGGKTLEEFYQSRKAMQAKHVRPESPYTVSIPMQVKYCTIRAYQRLWNDRTSTMTIVFGQIFMALIIGSIFYGTRNDTASFFQKGGVLFFAVLLNALIAIAEINNLYSQRPIVEKQASYAFYHPFTEALATIIADIPVKFAIATCFNIILYFLAGLRREPSQFFIYFLFNFIAILTMGQIYRSIAAATKTVSQALAIAGVITLAIVIYTGFVIPRPLMHPWFKWISWINPVAYAFEALFTNELHGRRFACSMLVPSGGGYVHADSNFICNIPGAVAGQTTVSGDDYLQSQFQYSYSHIWRNLGFMFAFMLFFLFLYLLATELNAAPPSTAEVLVFRRGHVPKRILAAEHSAKHDEETPSTEAGTLSTGLGEEQAEEVQALPPQRDIFTWKDVSYDIKIKGQPRRLLDNVTGWVKPGTLTALMGVSGAGKTTLLDVLAQRGSIGVVSGEMLVSGKPLDESFQRKTGYVQQQDLHLETTTVREALRFSAALRQPKSVSKKEKYEFVEGVIKMLAMQDFAEAVVGIPGEGLNVEQRKLLTIGVELAAKPALLLFLDEPTSGLDSQSSWAIVAFLRKLADSGQAVLATIHQPSAILFQEFDRLLLLATGGRTVYFGDIGKHSKNLLDFFESNGADKCGDDENPAEYMLTVVGAGPSGKSSKDWPAVWRDSGMKEKVLNELAQINQESVNQGSGGKSAEETSGAHKEFAMPFRNQLYEVTHRVFQQYWRTPGYIYNKLLLGVASALFNGFSFYHADSTQQGIQDVIFSIFMITTIFTSLVHQIMPRFILQRDLYEVRERPSKVYSWKAFLIANIIVEIPYQILLGVMVFGSYFYPVYTNDGIPSGQRQGLILLLLVQFFVFNSTFTHMLIAALPDSETAGHIATLMFSMTLTFNGVFQPPNALPGFWIFMYRVSPLTYFVAAVASTGLSGRPLTCSNNELAIMQPPAGMTCGQYLQPFGSATGGSIYNPGATSNCHYCAVSNADQYLASVSISYNTRWRDYGIGFAYIIFNVFMTVLLYYVIRVRKGSGRTIAERFGPILRVFKKDPERRGGKVEKQEHAEGSNIPPYF